MITESEARIIFDHACVPEHVPAYVMSVSGAEPFLSSEYLFYLKEDHLTFVGYSLGETADKASMQEVLNMALREWKPAQVAVIAEHALSLPMKTFSDERDDYFRITFANWSMPQKVRNMIHRAEQEVSVAEEKSLGEEHRWLIASFLDKNRISGAMRCIFEKIPHYVSSTATAEVFSARDRENRLVAFDVAELGARDYVFYMFNFRNFETQVPGVSDLLLHEIMKKASALRKQHINMGLGVNRGIRFFKKKWGGRVFLAYHYAQFGGSSRRSSFMDALARAVFR